MGLFDSEETALTANEKALVWIRGSLVDIIDGGPAVTTGEVLVILTVSFHQTRCLARPATLRRPLTLAPMRCWAPHCGLIQSRLTCPLGPNAAAAASQARLSDILDRVPE